MMDLLVQVQDAEAPFLVELLNKFDFVKVKQETTTSNHNVLNSLERSIKQMKDMKEGVLRKPNISELFGNE